MGSFFIFFMTSFYRIFFFLFLGQDLRSDISHMMPLKNNSDIRKKKTS